MRENSECVATLTESPRVLLARCLLEEEPTGCLEDEVTVEGGKALELRRDGVQDASVEW